MPKVDYKIVSGSASSLAAKVNALIAEGWLPVGGVTATADWIEIGPTIEYSFHQAMTKRND